MHSNKNSHSYSRHKEKTIKDELLIELHKQYAINNNSYFSSIVVFIVALFAAFGGYGYVFIHSNNRYDFFKLVDNTNHFSIDAVILTAVILLFVIVVISKICIYQGIAQRNEQFIIYKIRKKYNLTYDSKEKILPPGYHPFNKDHFQVVQGLYGELLNIMRYTIFLILLSLIIKLIQNVFECIKNGYELTWNGLIWLMPIFSLILYVYVLRSSFNKLYNIYYKRLIYYNDEKQFIDDAFKQSNEFKGRYVNNLSIIDSINLFLFSFKKRHNNYKINIINNENKSI